MVLLAANFRLILENIRKYGLLSKPFEWLRITEVHPRLMASWLSLPTLAMGSLMVEVKVGSGISVLCSCRQQHYCYPTASGGEQWCVGRWIVPVLDRGVAAGIGEQWWW